MKNIVVRLLPKTLMWIAPIALAGFLAFDPPPAAACGTCECVYASQCYSQGACREKQTCECNALCQSCYWANGCAPATHTLGQSGQS
jgi:hypothetical protein